jgi:Glycosyltransferase family 87
MRAPGRWVPLLQWRADQRKTIYLCLLILGLCALVFVIYIQKIWAEYESHTPGHPAPFGDFFAIWSYAKIAGTYSVVELYDLGALHARQVALGMDPGNQNPFPYPPTFILLLWPLSLLPYGVAYLVWTLGTLALFVWAVVATCSRLPLCTLGVIVSPVSIATIASGQSGFLAAALLTAGIRLAGSRPVVSGILLGILSYKPQLGILVPVALVAAGLWSTFSITCATVFGLAVAVTLAFGWNIWPSWLGMLPIYEDMFDRSNVSLQLMPTVIVNLKMAGFPSSIAIAVQALVTVVVAFLVWGCFRRSSGRLPAAALLVGTVLATPHAFIYDMPMVLAAMALFIQAHLEENRTFGLAEIIVLVLAMLFPALMMMAEPYLSLRLSLLSLILLFGLILRYEKQLDRGGRNGSTRTLQGASPAITDISRPMSPLW